MIALQAPLYEKHRHKDGDFPFLFHLDSLFYGSAFRVHWHESIEILCFVEGSAIVNSDGEHEQLSSGQTAVINSDNLHSIKALTESCLYYCLIIDKSICDGLGIDVDRVQYLLKISDPEISDEILAIASAFALTEGESADRYAKTALKLRIMSLLVLITRRYASERPQSPGVRQDKKSFLVRRVITYINANYALPLSTEKICADLGFSKYYVCHCFRELTGQTVTDYLNYRRCSHAQKLLSTGNCNVGEAAERCGFGNSSYFSKTYKRCMGVLPSSDFES